MLDNKHIICLASQDWESHWCVPQQTMRRLAQSNKILYVEPFYSFLYLFKHLKDWRKLVNKFSQTLRREDNLYIFSPPPLFFPFFGFSATLAKISRTLNNIVLSFLINRLAKKLKLTKPILWIYYVFATESIKQIDSSLIVYDCIDEWSGYAMGQSRKRVVRENDKVLCQKSGLVFVGSRNLFNLKKDYNPHTYLIPHAADIEHFLKAALPETKVPRDLADISKPVIGLIGVLDKQRIDVELISYLANSNPQYSIVLIGPVWNDLNVETLNRLNNIYFLGNRKIDELPNYLKGFDVCIIPYLINDFTRNSYPLKLHEYMSSGIPIVSTKLPACEEYSDVVKIASDKEEFKKNVATALKEENHKLCVKRIEIAKKNSWQERVEAKSKLIEERLLSYKKEAALF